MSKKKAKKEAPLPTYVTMFGPAPPEGSVPAKTWPTLQTIDERIDVPADSEAQEPRSQRTGVRWTYALRDQNLSEDDKGKPWYEWLPKGMIRAYELAAVDHWKRSLWAEVHAWFETATAPPSNRVKRGDKKLSDIEARLQRVVSQTERETLESQHAARLRELGLEWAWQGGAIASELRAASEALLANGLGRLAVETYRFPEEWESFGGSADLKKAGKRLARETALLAEIFATLEDFPKALDPKLPDAEARGWCVLYAHRLGMLACRLNLAAVDEAALSRSEGGNRRGRAKSAKRDQQERRHGPLYQKRMDELIASDVKNLFRSHWDLAGQIAEEFRIGEPEETFHRQRNVFDLTVHRGSRS